MGIQGLSTPGLSHGKKIDLLKTIISASSSEESVVMDFFCGSGTTLIAAQELNRNWVGVDKSEQAIKTTKKKLNKLEKTFFSNYEYSYLEVENIFELKILNEKDNRKLRHFA